jgi:hypothetical protein
VSQNGARRDDATGAPTDFTIAITGKPVLLEWSKKGTEIYYATDKKELYRVSHINDIMDLSQASYYGKFYTDVFKYTSPISSTSVNPVSPYRTTLLGKFTSQITSLSISKDGKNLALTFSSRTGNASDTLVMYNTNDASTSDYTNIVWTKKDASTLAGLKTYCSLMEMNDNKMVFVGTDNGVFYTPNIAATPPTWANVNSISDPNAKLPRVQVFDMKQQVLDAWDCYNSGQIYVATNGRGVWTTSNFIKGYFVDVQEAAERPLLQNELSIFPNPTNGNLNVRFEGFDGETANIQVMDISGRIVGGENLGKMSSGEVTHVMDLSYLPTGVYIVNVHSSSGKKRVAKLIVTK